jgi:hypothetical protein
MLAHHPNPSSLELSAETRVNTSDGDADHGNPPITGGTVTV